MLSHKTESGFNANNYSTSETPLTVRRGWYSKPGQVSDDRSLVIIIGILVGWIASH